jgi:hypothetical protein
MKTFFRKSRLAVALASLSLLSTGGTAQAALFEIDFTTAGAFFGQSGNIPASPGLNTVFATAVFDDHGGSGSVTLTMSVLNNLPAGAYVNDWYFNVSSAPLTNVTFVPGGTAATLASFTTANGYKADGTGGDFDLRFQFPSNNPGELAQGHTSVYNLVGTGINADSFNAFSVNAGTGGPYLSALHVQGYGNSVWIGGEAGGRTIEVPEPATLALIGFGLFGIAATRRRWT